MSRNSVSFTVRDVSAFAKSLRLQLGGRAALPSHVELLNMLARAAGYRNYQQLRADASAMPPLERSPVTASPDEAVDMRRVERAARHFDSAGILLRWPARASQQQLCLWALWASFPNGHTLDEPRVNAFLRTRHVFGDWALLRRALCDAGLVVRTPDGRAYRRVEKPPSPEARLLIARLGIRSEGFGEVQ